MSAATKTGSVIEPKAATPAAAARTFSSARSVLLQRKCACGGEGPGECEACQKKEAEEQQKKQSQRLQKSSSGPSRASTAPPIVNRVLNSPGRALDADTRSFMEPRFGRDFSGVRVHTDSQAAESARAVDAHAYTVGQHIVFDHGKYAPHSGSGRQLLAHELAHTVQQHGLQRSSENLSLGEGNDYRRLEREAETIARSLTHGPGAKGSPTLTSHPTEVMLSRAERKGADETEPPTKDADPEREWDDVDGRTKLGKCGVKQIANPGKRVSKDITAVNMAVPLKLPAEKGYKKVAEDLWKKRAAAGALEALVDVSGNVRESPRIALKQERPPTKDLRQIWLKKVGWAELAEGTIGKKWKKAGGDKNSFDPPQAGGLTCHVDHIVELQFGGANVPENLQMLDGDDNMLSGRKINDDLVDLANRIHEALPDSQNLIIHYDDVVQEQGKHGPCVRAEAEAKPGPDEGEADVDGEEYEVKAGGFSDKLILAKGKKKNIDIEGQTAAKIIPGLLLSTFTPIKGPGTDTIEAVFDDSKESKTRLPVSIPGRKPVTLVVDPTRNLKLLSKRPNLKFHFDYLSDGIFTELEIHDDRSLSGKGTIKSSIPFLPELHVKFDKESFALVAPLDAKKLKPPIPGAKITEGEIGLQLAPQFKPYGNLAFELVTGPKKILDGKIEVTADAQGLLATGVIHVFLPGVDNAEGTVKYQNREWSGGVKIESTQMQSKLKYVKSGSVVVGLTGKGISAEGKVGLDIPGTSGVEVSLLYEKHKWLFRGKGAFTPPRLKPVEIELEYDGDHITGSAETGFEFHGLTGRLQVRYKDEKFSGEGTINIKKGRAEGKLHIKMRQEKDEPKFSGEGEVTYQLTDNLVGTAGIEVNEKEEVRLKGALTFPKPIHLFDPIKGDYKIFEIGVSIPIPGASIGPVGLNARIEGALSAGYQIGPGELRNAKIEAAFNPLEEKPDLDVVMGAQLYIGARAYISGSITGAIEVSIGIASVSGGLTITATASLEGHVASEVKIHYQKSRLELDANFEVLLGLALMLALDAVVKAKAGVGPFSVETKKVWNLAAFKFDTGMQLGMKLKKPIHYASDQPFQFPSLDDIQWIKPDIDPKKVLERAFGSGSSKEEEAR
ncbi:MAG TPA: DUF4157 domain-containing protein [Terracidiphilus sp.]|jgi:hypothetical protein